MNQARYPGSLKPFQQDLLRAFDAHGHGYFLTGGAALAGFYGSHRPTRDLDLFTRDSEIFGQTPRILAGISDSLDCKMENLRTTVASGPIRF